MSSTSPRSFPPDHKFQDNRDRLIPGASRYIQGSPNQHPSSPKVHRRNPFRVVPYLQSGQFNRFVTTDHRPCHAKPNPFGLGRVEMDKISRAAAIANAIEVATNTSTLEYFRPYSDKFHDDRNDNQEMHDKSETIRSDIIRRDEVTTMTHRCPSEEDFSMEIPFGKTEGEEALVQPKAGANEEDDLSNQLRNQELRKLYHSGTNLTPEPSCNVSVVASASIPMSLVASEHIADNQRQSKISFIVSRDESEKNDNNDYEQDLYSYDTFATSEHFSEELVVEWGMPGVSLIDVNDDDDYFVGDEIFENPSDAAHEFSAQSAPIGLQWFDNTMIDKENQERR